MLHPPWISQHTGTQNRTGWAQMRAASAAILRFAVSAIGLVIVAVNVAAWLNPNPFGPTAPLRVGMADSGRTIALKVNDQLDIVLDDYTTPGHGWEVAAVNDDVVSIPHPIYTRDWSGGGRTWFAVTADQPGRTRITIIHDQAPNSLPISPFSIDIVVVG